MPLKPRLGSRCLGLRAGEELLLSWPSNALLHALDIGIILTTGVPLACYSILPRI